MYCIIDLQRSNFCNGYYINYKIFCKDLHEYDEIFKLVIGDISGRILFNFNNDTSLIDLDEYSDTQIIPELTKSIHKLIIQLNYGLKSYLQQNPDHLHAIPLKAKPYLNNLLNT